MTPTPPAPIVPIPPATTLSYEQSNLLMQDTSFRGRIKVACLHFAAYIAGEAPGVPAHNTRVKWAQNTMVNPDMTANQVQPPTVMQDQVQTAGSDITDQDLQTAVETTVNELI